MNTKSQPAGLNYHQTYFLTSASTVAQCPPDNVLEAAFIGRSNAGKSSALNVLTGQRKLARTSKTPGRTQLLNFFQITDDKYLVDLPGFGYAKVPLKVKIRWQRQLEKYLQERQSLQGLILLMDIRHPFKDFDRMIIDWANKSEMPLHILLTKSDKLKKGAARTVLLTVEKHLAHYGELVSAQLFSSLNKEGVDGLKEKLDSWLGKTVQEKPPGKKRRV